MHAHRRTFVPCQFWLSTKPDNSKYVFGGWASAIKQLEGMQLQVSAHTVVAHPRRSHVTKADDVADLRGASWIHLAISCNWIWFICLGTPDMCQIQAAPGAYVSSLVLWKHTSKTCIHITKPSLHAFPSAVTFRNWIRISSLAFTMIPSLSLKLPTADSQGFCTNDRYQRECLVRIWRAKSISSFANGHWAEIKSGKGALMLFCFLFSPYWGKSLLMKGPHPSSVEALWLGLWVC